MTEKPKSYQQLEKELEDLRRKIAELEHIQEKGQREQQMWETLMANTPDLVYFKDAHHGIIKASDSYAAEVGVDLENLPGKTAADLWPHQAEEILADERRVLSGKAMIRKERSVINAAGETRWYLLTKVPIYQDGEVIGFFAMDKDITQRKEAEQALQKSESRFRRIYESNMIGIAYWDESGQITDANQAYLEMIGYSREEITKLKLSWKDITPDTYAELDRQATREIKLRGTCSPYEKEYLKKDGSRVPILIGGASLEGEDFLGITFAIDLTERKKAQEETTRRRMYLESVLKEAPDAIVTLDAQHHIVEWNPGASSLFGYTAEEAVGKELDDLITRPEVVDEAVEITNKVQEGQHIGPKEVVRYHKDGTPVPVILAGAPILVDGELIGAVGVYTDITERVEMEEKLRERALRDTLTGLYNRRGFSLLANQQLKIANREHRKMVLLFADIDKLKRINDNHGHQQGDRAIQKTARLLDDTFRESDIIARLGGDEFVVLALESNQATPDSLVERLKNHLVALNLTQQLPFDLSVSIGWMCYDPADPLSLEELMARADQAMYNQK